jgi:beta-lactamase superfamily II metal-dependent hydrolase
MHFQGVAQTINFVEVVVVIQEKFVWVNSVALKSVYVTSAVVQKVKAVHNPSVYAVPINDDVDLCVVLLVRHVIMIKELRNAVDLRTFVLELMGLCAVLVVTAAEVDVALKVTHNVALMIKEHVRVVETKNLAAVTRIYAADKILSAVKFLKDIGDQTLKNDTGTTNNKCSRPSASEKKKKTAETILMPPLELNSTLPAPNGNMNIFALPIGQGEANVIQCPSTNRALVIDIGSRGGLRMSRDAMANFINAGTTAGQTNVTHIIISHADADHCNWIPNIFNTTDRRANIAYVIIGGLRSDYPVTTRTWFSSLPATAAVIELNSGNSCLGNLNCGVQSQLANICGDGSVGIQIIAANMGSRVYTNTNSVIVKVTHHSTTMLFPGDFEDSSPTGNEQHDLVTHAGSSLPAEIYKVAHHGASTLANSVELLMAISPTYAIFSSRYPDRQYFHPRCATVNRLIFDITSIEVYSQNSNIPFACGYGDHTVWETKSICYGFFSTTPLPNGIQIVQVVSNAQGYSFFRTAVAPGMMENGDEVNDTCIIPENDKIIDGKAHHDEL